MLWAGYSVAILFLLFLIFDTITSPPASLTPIPTPSPIPEASKAAIVDQVALTDPDPEFVKKASAYLQDAGFDVDVYQAEEITVDFYRTLPTKGYKLILVRTHSTVALRWGDEHLPGPVSLCTSELYSEYKWVDEQVAEQIGSVRTLYPRQGPLYFAIRSGFVIYSMVGRFDDTLIILGGCQSMGIPDMAGALVGRGASAVIGWDEWVDLSHNDKAILHLLRALTLEKLTVKQAMEKTMNEVGPDPTFRSILTYYPQREGDSTIWDKAATR